MRTLCLSLFSLTMGAAAPVTAQDPLYSSRSVMGGFQIQNYSFRQGYRPDNVSHIRQYSVPLGFVIPFGKRLSLDVGAQYAHTESKTFADTTSSFNGLTDTQVRGSYTFGNDAVVTTLMLNLPTGVSQDSASRQAIASSAASNFLSFPVNTYGTGFYATGGVAVAQQLGSWNVGLAGSLRLSTKYQPFNDPGNAFKYRAGSEVRFRLGVDRLLGSSRFNAGFTFSTFGNDQFSALPAPTTNGSYSPGSRFISEIGITAPVGTSSVSAYMWDYYRASSDTSVSNRENVFAIGALGSIPLGKGVSLEPLAETRIWSPKDGGGYLIGGGAALRLGLTPHFSFVPGGRYDRGALKNSGKAYLVTGWGVTSLLRYEF